ncbi:hypothetical protein GWI33_023104 [Rhynchophorus ferrugineus]|uniref:Cuticle protein n=1 Tax=Rhynchophorus ferrugineus TaxID=354439 RepID=A0A834ITP6_RHYFE|nr:hypothetical protein GWI33_023104 [Rhynchophorus ferrugineus]
MRNVVVFLGLFALAAAQFPLSSYPEVTPAPWKGPYADHVIGQVPKDTPEVAAAKEALNRAYSQVLAVLPVLPQEEQHDNVHNAPLVVKNDHYAFHPIAPQPAQIQTTTSANIPQYIYSSHLTDGSDAYARAAHLRAIEDTLASLEKLIKNSRL